MGGLFSSGPSGLKAAQQQSAEAYNLATGPIETQGGQIYHETQPLFTSALQYLQDITSPDSSARMAAAAPMITDITNQTQGAVQQTQNLPRGGERDYLAAQAAQTGASNVSNALVQAFTQGQAAKIAVGQQGITDWLNAATAAANIELGASGVSLNLSQLQAAGSQATMQTIAQVAEMAAAALA